MTFVCEDGEDIKRCLSVLKRVYENVSCQSKIQFISYVAFFVPSISFRKSQKFNINES